MDKMLLFKDKMEMYLSDSKLDIASLSDIYELVDLESVYETLEHLTNNAMATFKEVLEIEEGE